jgi:hypothetical protein
MLADYLARLIRDGHARLAALDAATQEAANDGALHKARVCRAQALQERRELNELRAMRDRLARRFLSDRSPITTVSPAENTRIAPQIDTGVTRRTLQSSERTNTGRTNTGRAAGG